MATELSDAPDRTDRRFATLNGSRPLVNGVVWWAYPGFWVLAGASVVLLLLAAKTHGRQLRLERELQGVTDVAFDATTDPPWLAALWSRERRQYWTFVPVASVVGGVIAFVGGRDDLAVVAAFLWSPTLGLLGLGFVSLRRFNRALAERMEAPGPDSTGRADPWLAPRRIDEIRATRGAWFRSAVQGTFRWWTITCAFALATAAFALVAAPP
ncbi:MAG: hypothetical protein ACYDDF_05755 [Thermoplasmatota archaeon]